MNVRERRQPVLSVYAAAGDETPASTPNDLKWPERGFAPGHFMVWPSDQYLNCGMAFSWSLVALYTA